MLPMIVADFLPRAERRPIGIVAFQPAADVEDIRLLIPQESREGLPLNEPLVVGGVRRMDAVVEFVGFAATIGDDVVNFGQVGQAFSLTGGRVGFVARRLRQAKSLTYGLVG